MTDKQCAPVSRRLAIRAGAGVLAGPALGAGALLMGCDKASEFAGSAPESVMVLLDGTRLSTAQLLGKVSLINFWATSCTTCVAEMPQMAATYERYKNQAYEMVAVAMSYDPPAYVVNFAQTRKLPFKVAIDNTGAVAKAWGDVQLTPTTYLLDRRAHIVKRYVGAPDFSAMHVLIDKLLAQSP